MPASRWGAVAAQMEEDVVLAALSRVLHHARQHGEVYPGATDDHAVLTHLVEHAETEHAETEHAETEHAETTESTTSETE